MMSPPAEGENVYSASTFVSVGFLIKPAVHRPPCRSHTLEEGSLAFSRAAAAEAGQDNSEGTDHAFDEC